jgi:hypothetical protein
VISFLSDSPDVGDRHVNLSDASLIRNIQSSVLEAHMELCFAQGQVRSWHRELIYLNRHEGTPTGLVSNWATVLELLDQTCQHC